MAFPDLAASPLQCLEVTRLLFRQEHHSVRFTWGYLSLTVAGSFLMKYPGKDGSLCLGWSSCHQFSVCLLSPLHVSSAHPGIFTWILSLSVLPQATWNAAKHLVLPFWATMWSTHRPLSAHGAANSWASLAVLAQQTRHCFLFPLGFYSATVLNVGFHWHQKSMNVVRLLHVEQQCF